MTERNDERLREWQDKLSLNLMKYQPELDRMDEREKIYSGDRTLRKLVTKDKKLRCEHVWNIAAEMIESCVDSSVPTPKVTALRPQDELLAKLIEDMLRNEITRIGFQSLNDMSERTVPIQGGAPWLIEWDSSQRSQGAVGELSVEILHPKYIVPQDGIYTDVNDMDYIILRIPQTKEHIRQMYGIDVSDEVEEEPNLRSSGSEEMSDEMVTQNIAYYRNAVGGIGMYSWVRETQLCDYEDYQARRLSKCRNCGEPEPIGIEAGKTAVCPKCGCRSFTNADVDFEEVWEPIKRTFAEDIPGSYGVLPEGADLQTNGNANASSEMTGDLNQVSADIPMETGNGQMLESGRTAVATKIVPTKIPFYKPNLFPVILQKNISKYGQLLGESDIDKIADQQNTVNRLSMKIIDKLLKAGSMVTLPPNGKMKFDATDMEPIMLKDPSEREMIGVHTLEGSIEQDMAYISQVYEEARNSIGITDSYQGKVDRTATSGKAKEFSASQAAGRMESKRIMKNAAYSKLFEAMFKFKLAYADEPRPVISQDAYGQKEYRDFNRYDFLERDEDGEWYWNDRFLFSCDTTSSLAANREAMWQETRNNFISGAFGDPSNIDTLILFWTKMEVLHYPDAGDTKSYLLDIKKKQEAEAEAQRQAMLEQQKMQEQQAMAKAQEEAAYGAAKQARADARADAEFAVNKKRAERDAEPTFEQILSAKERARQDAVAALGGE